MQSAGTEDYLSSLGLSDLAVCLATAVRIGSQSLLEANRHLFSRDFEMKEDGSMVGALDKTSDTSIAEYLNSTPAVGICRFRSEEGMEFRQPSEWEYAAIIDPLDGSINPRIGGTNLHYIGVGGAVHRKPDDEQVIVAACLSFDDNALYVAEKGKRVYRVTNEDVGFQSRKLMIFDKPAQVNTFIQSGWRTPYTRKAEEALHRNGFYEELDFNAGDVMTAGIFQTVSTLRDYRQVLINIAASHQADFSYLFLQEAGADVIANDGMPMHSQACAMLSITPSYKGDAGRLRETFVRALNGYHDHNNTGMQRVCD